MAELDNSVRLNLWLKVALVHVACPLDTPWIWRSLQ